MLNGDGSDGDLYVSAGNTVNLLLDHKYQYKTITVEAGATISTTATSGAVLYLACQGLVNIAGSIILNNKMANGDYTGSVVIDGNTYISPGCQLGNVGGTWAGQTPPASVNGFGSGGSGGTVTFTSPAITLISIGGAGASSGVTGGGGGAQSHAPDNAGTHAEDSHQGGNGSNSGGGGGGTLAFWQYVSGSGPADVVGFSGGAGGGGSHGAGGASGQNPSGTVSAGGSLSITYSNASFGGGGAGGIAGKPGIQLVIRAAEIALQTGSVINTSGTAGGNGGAGGTGYLANSAYIGGLGGGGGGGGRGGNVKLFYGSKLLNSATITMSGAAGGSGGANGSPTGGSGGSAASGSSGTLTTTRAEAAYGSMLDFFQ